MHEVPLIPSSSVSVSERQERADNLGTFRANKYNMSVPDLVELYIPTMGALSIPVSRARLVLGLRRYGFAERA